VEIVLTGGLSVLSGLLQLQVYRW